MSVSVVSGLGSFVTSVSDLGSSKEPVEKEEREKRDGRLGKERRERQRRLVVAERAEAMF